MENRYLREYIVIQAGCTPGWVELVRTNTGIYILNMLGDVNPENRWIWPFTEAIMKAFEAIEEHLEHHGGDGPSALLTISSSNKFFSNGIDPTGEYTKSLRLDQIQSKNSKLYNTAITMPAFSRPLQLPMPTIAAINGHAFGAGFMFTACHDYRLQREDRGYQCAIEIEIGVGIPPPEMAMFRLHLQDNDWYDTVMGAKRWNAQASVRAGLNSKACSSETLYQESLEMAEQQSKFARGVKGRLLYMSIKNQAKGHLNQQVMEYNYPNGKMPKILQQNPDAANELKEKYPYLLSHRNENIHALPGGNIMGGFQLPTRQSKM